jgi:hypothetical protein
VGPVYTGHHQVRDDQVDPATLEGFQSLLAIVASDDAVAARFEQNFAYGKGLFVVINTQDRLLGLHGGIGSPHSAKIFL